MASTITLSCFAWMLFFVLGGGSQTGKSLMEDFLSSWMENTKDGIPLVMLVYPVLIAASLCALFNNTRNSRGGISCFFCCPPRWWKPLTMIQPALRPAFQQLVFNHGDGNLDLYAWIFQVIPFFIYSLFGIHRRMVPLGVNLFKLALGVQQIPDDDQHTARKITSGIGNAFGMTAIVAMAFFLVPDSKFGPILKSFGWSHAIAIRLHIWCGRVIVIASLLHGMFHAMRWKYQFGEDVQAFIFPPRQCWTTEEDGFAPTCKNSATDCTCYNHLVNFTGTVAVLLLILIFVTSSNWVRRKCYNVFLMIHLLAGPFCLFAVILHYHSAILYVAPSLLYYAATSLPPFLERRQKVGVHVVSVDIIGTTATATNRSGKYVSLTFEATRETVKAFRPGMYATLSVPSISKIGHPFTINRVPGADDQLRVIFRVAGPFTRQLTTLLEAESRIPIIHFDGFHGNPSRMHQLQQHDVNILVAGGVGVTPFLSLIGDAVAGHGEDPYYYNASRMQSLSLHWMCRDKSLIEYVRREYLDHLEGRAATPIQVHIHQTSCNPAVSNEDVSSCNKIRRLCFPSRDTVQFVEPFRISRFGPSARISSNLGPFLSLTIILWPGLAIVWRCYTNLQVEKEIRGRLFAPLAFLLYTFVVSYVLARILPYGWFGKSSPSSENDWKVHNEDSEYSPDETSSLSRCPLAGYVGQTRKGENSDCEDGGTHFVVRLECHPGRPALETLLESIENARWPAIFSCGPSAMSTALQTIANEKWRNSRSALEPSSEPLPWVTIYDESFLI